MEAVYRQEEIQKSIVKLNILQKIWIKIFGKKSIGMDGDYFIEMYEYKGKFYVMKEDYLN